MNEPANHRASVTASAPRGIVCCTAAMSPLCQKGDLPRCRFPRRCHPLWPAFDRSRPSRCAFIPTPVRVPSYRQSEIKQKEPNWSNRKNRPQTRMRLMCSHVQIQMLCASLHASGAWWVAFGIENRRRETCSSIALPRSKENAKLISELKRIVGNRHVLTSPSSTHRFRKRFRLATGPRSRLSDPPA